MYRCFGEGDSHLRSKRDARTRSSAATIDESASNCGSWFVDWDLVTRNHAGLVEMHGPVQGEDVGFRGFRV